MNFNESSYCKRVNCRSLSIINWGLYRGIAPGSLRSFVGNGSAMVVMQYLQKKVTELGLRDS